ncbi:Lrp/AsnC family transcriptional regulator [Candidatus Woesearchaeota archaeon]|jgi:drug/metabolite transporter (DMT)-like permease|nr:Lrp/AsnC family transcriptional regulator [Candidatus Woesearchaeota archaeon]
MNYKTLALLSGLFLAINIVFDSYNLQVVFSNIYNYALIGSWVAVILTLVIMFFFGKKLDTNFKGVGLIPKKSRGYALVAGFTGAAYTLLLLYLLKIYDPTVVGALIPLTLLFLIIRDLYYTKEKISVLEAGSFIIVAVGAFLISFKGGRFDLMVILTAGIILNLINAVYSHFMKLGMDCPNTDALNYRLFITITLAVIFTVCIFPQTNLSFEVLSQIPYSIGSMFFAFLGYVLYLLSLKDGKVSFVSALNLSYVAFTFLFTVVLAFVIPKVFLLELNSTFWIMRGLGALLILVGIVILVLSVFSSFIFIKCEPRKVNYIYEELKKLNEVKKIYQTFGKHSLIVLLEVKSEGRLGNTINQKIRIIEGIKEVSEARIVKS